MLWVCAFRNIEGKLLWNMKVESLNKGAIKKFVASFGGINFQIFDNVKIQYHWIKWKRRSLFLDISFVYLVTLWQWGRNLGGHWRQCIHPECNLEYVTWAFFALFFWDYSLTILVITYGRLLWVITFAAFLYSLKASAFMFIPSASALARAVMANASASPCVTFCEYLAMSCDIVVWILSFDLKLHFNLVNCSRSRIVDHHN